MTSYTRSTEIRQILFELDSLANILEDDWSQLFWLIPRRIADIDLPPKKYHLKYNGTQEGELRDYCKRHNVPNARQLLEEWGTSGQREERPTIGHLLKLLAKGEMFRAADYVALELLKETPPARPRHGPAAAIDVNSELRRVEELNLNAVLEQMPYPSSSFLQNGMPTLSLENNLDRPTIPKRDEVIDFPRGPLDATVSRSVQRLSNSNNNDQSVEADIPMPWLSDLLRTEPLEGPSGMTGACVQMRESSSEDEDSYGESDSSRSSRSYSHSRHELSSVLGTIREDEEFVHVSSESTTARSAGNIPFISALLDSSSRPSQQNQYDSAANLPDFAAMGLSQGRSFSSASQTDSGSTNTNSYSMHVSSSHVPPSVPISVPYSSLETSTANFDDRPFTNRDLTAPDGRALGKGGFGEVFLALNISQVIPVSAVKRLSPSNYKYKEKFRLECDILSKHSHPNIIRLLGYSEDNLLCLVYEYLPDGTLEQMLHKYRSGQVQFLVARRLSYLSGVACAIEYLHSAQVKLVHRDVTLANILLHDDVAKLCDFGLVKRIENMTTTGVIGTGPYLAPEALRGTITPALDIYAFGVVIAAVVTGEDINVSNGEMHLLDRIMAEGVDLGAMVDRNVDQQWLRAGHQLLELTVLCLQELSKRPSAQILRECLESISRAE